jgi:hypothetical protein
MLARRLLRGLLDARRAREVSDLEARFEARVGVEADGVLDFNTFTGMVRAVLDPLATDHDAVNMYQLAVQAAEKDRRLGLSVAKPRKRWTVFKSSSSPAGGSRAVFQPPLVLPVSPGAMRRRAGLPAQELLTAYENSDENDETDDEEEEDDDVEVDDDEEDDDEFDVFDDGGQGGKDEPPSSPRVRDELISKRAFVEAVLGFGYSRCMSTGQWACTGPEFKYCLRASTLRLAVARQSGSGQPQGAAIVAGVSSGSAGVG